MAKLNSTFKLVHVMHTLITSGDGLSCILHLAVFSPIDPSLTRSRHYTRPFVKLVSFVMPRSGYLDEIPFWCLSQIHPQ